MNLNEKKPSALLIDGNNIAYRSYFAIPPLTTSDNIPTNAIYGFLSMLFNTRKNLKPDYLAICFDSKEKTNRSAEYKEYKATRKPMPESLILQMKLLKEEVLKPLGISYYEQSGVEADDLLATLSRHFNRENIYVRILSGDRDMIQLVKDGFIQVCSPVSGTADLAIYGEHEVMEQYGITPTQMIDYKALVGDPSDNIQGVPSIGPKTAQKWLKKYGTIEKILEEGNVETAKARECKEIIQRNQRLIHLVEDVPLSIQTEKMVTKEWDREAMTSLLHRFELKTLGKRFSFLQPEERAVLVSLPLEEINSEEQGKEIFNKKRLAISWDEKGNLFLFDGTKRYQVCLLKDNLFSTWNPKRWIEELLQDKEIQKLVFNAKELLHFVQPLKKEKWTSILDMQLFWYLWKPNATRYEKDDFMKEFSVGPGYLDEVLWEAFPVLDEEIKTLGLSNVYETIELPLLFLLYRMEEKGLRVDRATLLQVKQKLGTLLVERQAEINQLAGTEINVLSPKQVSFLLFEKLGLPSSKKTKTGYSTDASVLEELSSLHPVVDKILSYKEMSKVQTTYVENFLTLSSKDSTLHTTYLQAGPATGRLSSRSPNLQNLPMDEGFGKQLRDAIVPSSSSFVFLSADYSQIDLRVMAHFSRDKNMVKAVEQGADIHESTARLLFHLSPNETPKDEMRTLAKTINFGVLYGMAPHGLAQALKISEGEASRFIETYFVTFSGVAEWIQQTIRLAENRGYVETLLGHRRQVPELQSTNKMIRKLGERIAVNTIIQGTSADVIKMAMLAIDKHLPNQELYLLLQIHDELIFEAEETVLNHWSSIIKQEMEQAIHLAVPLVVHLSSGKTLGSLH